MCEISPTLRRKLVYKTCFPMLAEFWDLTLGIFPWFVPLTLPYPARLVACACPRTEADDPLANPPAFLTPLSATRRPALPKELVPKNGIIRTPEETYNTIFSSKPNIPTVCRILRGTRQSRSLISYKFQSQLYDSPCLTQGES